MAGIGATGQHPEQTLRQILELACAALPGGDEGGITLFEAEGPGIAIATSDAVRRVDRSQYDAEAGGPCLEAYRRQQILRIDATTRDQRWPQFAETAAAEGMASTLSVPLVVGGDGLGALNIYCRYEFGFPADDERLASALGSCASVALANARTDWRAIPLADQRQRAVSGRGVVEQATGILIAQHYCSAEHAFDLLTAAAQGNRLTIDEVADDLVQRTTNQEQLA